MSVRFCELTNRYMVSHKGIGTSFATMQEALAFIRSQHFDNLKRECSPKPTPVARRLMTLQLTLVQED